MKLVENHRLHLSGILKNSEAIFWDFDGVVKDSVEVKSEAFEYLFLPFGKMVAEKIRGHHEKNSGISRFEKLPIYLKWSGQEPSVKLVNEYAKKFSLLVVEKVIDSKWVPGVLKYIENNYNRQHFFLVTATPQNEINGIISKLNIKHFFKETIGSPIKKDNSIRYIMEKYSLSSENSIMIGDSRSDYNAAKINKIQFILRSTNLNKKLQEELKSYTVENLLTY
jgi:phosphoglycolate phosphatase-like HAD superfamily hydrolase